MTEGMLTEKYGGKRKQESSGLKKELVKLKGWACCNGQRRWGGSPGCTVTGNTAAPISS